MFSMECIKINSMENVVKIYTITQKSRVSKIILISYFTSFEGEGIIFEELW